MIITTQFYTILFFFNFYFFCLFRAWPMAYGRSQSKGQIRAVAFSLHHSNTRSWATASTYAAACGKAGSLTHWASKPGTKPASLWILVRLLTCWATMEMSVSFLTSYVSALFELFYFFYLFNYLFIVFLPFLGPLLLHMEVPRLGV